MLTQYNKKDQDIENGLYGINNDTSNFEKPALLYNNIRDNNENNNIGDNNTRDDNSRDNNYKIIDSKKLRMEIITQKIYPAYKEDVDNCLFQRKMWSTMFSIFSTFTILMISASTVVSFSAPQFPNITYISYFAGVLGVIALMCERFAHYCGSQSSVNTQKLNILLKSIGVNDEMPDIMTIDQQNFSEHVVDEKQKIIK